MGQFQTFLKEYFGDAIETTYLDPPASMQMVYPCLLITRDKGETKFADNQVFRHQKRYLVTGISDAPDSPLYDLLASLPRSHHERSFSADNLTHDVFTIFFEEESA